MLFDKLVQAAYKREHYRLHSIHIQLHRHELHDGEDLPAVARFTDTLLESERAFYTGLGRKKERLATCPTCDSPDCLACYHPRSSQIGGFLGEVFKQLFGKAT